MADTDPIQEFMALPREQQMSTLQGLAPDKQDKLLAQVKQRKSGGKPAAVAAATPPASQGEDRTFGNYATEIATGLGRGVTNTVGGLAASILHPRQTVSGMIEGTRNAWDDSMKSYADTGSNAASFLTFLEENPVTGGFVTRTEKGNGFFSPESVGAGVEAGVTFGAGPEAMSRTVSVLPKVAGKVAKAVGPGTRAVTELVENTRKANEDSAAKAADANKAATEKTLADRGKVDEANAKQAEADKQARLKVIRENKAAADAHAAGKADTEAANREAIRQQEKIKPTQQKLDDATSELRAREETVRENALKVGNEKYDTVREKLNNVPADQEAITNAYGEALHSLGEAGVVPPILKRLEGVLKEPMSYKDNQILYSELGKELSKGTLPGPTYHAYDILHEAIGNDMQRIADDNGMGAELSDARNYWRRMKQTFGKRLSQNDNATAAVQAANPDFLAEDAQGNRLRLLGSFDPEIPKVAQHVENLRKGVASLPKEAPLRDVVQIPEPKPEAKPVPAPKPPKMYPEPHGSIPAVETKIGPEEVQGANKAALAETSNKVSNFGTSKFLSGIALFEVIRDLMGGNLEGAGKTIAARTAVYAGSKAIAALLEKPAVVEFLTKPTAEQLNSIPPDLRKNMPAVIEEAKRKGIKVNPALLTKLGIAAGATNSVKGPKTRELESLRNNPQQ